jgi:hypothetical protein
MSFVTDELVQFEAGKPAKARVPAFCDAGKGFVLPDAGGVADGQVRRVEKGEETTRPLPKAIAVAPLDERESTIAPGLRAG